MEELADLEQKERSANRLVRVYQLVEPILSVVMMTLALVALVLALIQYKDSRRQLDQLQSFSNTMGTISGQISTQFLNVFPSNLVAITDFVTHSDANLDIMVDYAGYGQYSRPEEFDRYFEALKALPPKAKVRLLVYSNSLADTANRQQFPESDFRNEKNQQRFQHYFRDVHSSFVEPCGFDEFVKNLTYEDFIHRIVAAQPDYQRILKDRNIEVRFVDEELVLFLWLRDNKDAIFSFKNQGATLRELSFKTADRNLVEVYRNIFDQQWAAADPNNPRKRPGQTTVQQIAVKTICNKHSQN